MRPELRVLSGVAACAVEVVQPFEILGRVNAQDLDVTDRRDWDARELGGEPAHLDERRESSLVSGLSKA